MKTSNRKPKTRVTRPKATTAPLEDEDFMLQMIPADFNVSLVSRVGASALFMAEREDHFHFVIYTQFLMEGGGQAGGTKQFHVPHYSMAAAFANLNQLQARVRDAAECPLSFQVPLGDAFKLLLDNELWHFAYNGNRFTMESDTGSKVLKRLQKWSARLAAADKAVKVRNGLFYLPGAKTVGKLAIEHKQRKLVRAIAFEREIHGNLDACNRFGIYSAFCTYRDSPIVLRQEDTQRELIEAHFNCYGDDFSNQALVEAALKVQDSVFPFRMWAPGLSVDFDHRLLALRSAVGKLQDHQCTQFTFANGMHEGSLFPALAAITNCISFDEYKDLIAAHCQPDSDQEQWIRNTASYIDLFGQLASANT
jgi:hypothetical protein